MQFNLEISMIDGTPATIDTLPLEMLVPIFAKLNPRDFSNIGLVNWKFATLLRQDFFWRTLIKELFPYLIITKPKLVQQIPKEIFIKEFLVWRKLMKDLNMDVNVMLASFRGDVTDNFESQLCFRMQKALVSLAQQNHLCVEQFPYGSSIFDLMHKDDILRMTAADGPWPLSPAIHISVAEVVKTMLARVDRPRFIHPTIGVVKQFVKETLVTENTYAGNLYRKLKQMSLAQLHILQGIADKVILLEDYTPEEKMVLEYLFGLTLEEENAFLSSCEETFGPRFQIPQEILAVQRFNTYRDFAQYLMQNRFPNYYECVVQQLAHFIQLRAAQTQPPALSINPPAPPFEKQKHQRRR